MARILAIANIKGGVGKTTTTANLSAALAARGRRVLAIDLDPQASLTLTVGLQPEHLVATIRDALTMRSATAESLVVTTLEKFDLIPSNRELRYVERELDGASVRPFVLRDALEPIRGRYDYIVLDCPANAGILTGNALAAATDVIIPFPPDYLALQTVEWLIQLIQEIRGKLNPNLRVTGFLLAMYTPGTRHAREIITTARSRYGIEIPFFSSAIRLDDELRSAPLAGQTVIRHAPDSPSAMAYRHLAEEIEAGVREPEPVDAAGAVRRARVALAASDRKAAYRDFFRATQFNPGLAEGWTGRAQTSDDENEIIRCWARALQLDTACEQARVALSASVTARLGKTGSPDIRQLMALGHYLIETQQRLHAELIFRHVTELAPQHAEAWLGRAHAADDSQVALTYIQKADQLAPNDPHIRPELEEVQRRMRAEGAGLVDDARRADQKGDRAGAHALYRRAAELDPKNDRAWLGCARTCDDQQEALAFARRALEANPDNVEASNLYHWLWVPEKSGILVNVPWGTVLSIMLALVCLGVAALLLYQHFTS